MKRFLLPHFPAGTRMSRWGRLQTTTSPLLLTTDKLHPPTLHPKSGSLEADGLLGSMQGNFEGLPSHWHPRPAPHIT